MAKPILKGASFPNGPMGKQALHKSPKNPDKAVITFDPMGGPIAVGDGITIIGGKGKFPTVWEGSVTKVNANNTCETDNLGVIRPQKERQDEKQEDKKPRGPEEVSTTVSNGDASDPVKTTVDPL